VTPADSSASRLSLRRQNLVQAAPDLGLGRFLCYAHGEKDLQSHRINFATREVETITEFNELHRRSNTFTLPNFAVRRDSSLIFFRDISSREIYAFDVR
jgi:hypothetical protein